MAILKEWRCATHGSFDSTHPICPNFGCDSSQVEREFRTPVSVGSSLTRRTDASLRKSAEFMGISNWNSAKEGESSFAGRAVQENETVGSKVLWGNETEKVLGRALPQLIGMAQQPFHHTRPDGTEVTLTRNNALAEAASEMGITTRALPKAREITYAAGDTAPAKAAS